MVVTDQVAWTVRSFDVSRQSATVCLIKSPSRQHRAIAGLAERLSTLPGPRDRRGRRHPFVYVLLVACSAVVTGAKSFATIGQWARNAPQDALIRLGARAVSVFGVRIAPSTATIRRIITTVCPGGLADLLGCDPADAGTLAVDGKSARNSRHGSTPAAHLLAAMTGSGQTVTQLRVPDKTNDITCFADLLAPFALSGATVTADALHAQRDHARFLVEDKKAHDVLCVKKNQPALFERLHSLPWKEVAAKFYDRTEGHGRKETRVVQVLTVEDLDFPHAAQVARITLHRTCLTSGRRTRETVYVRRERDRGFDPPRCPTETLRRCTPEAQRRCHALLPGVVPGPRMRREGDSHRGAASHRTPVDSLFGLTLLWWRT
ncbi:ISAs1 family transposase [Streptomyces sp. RM1]